MSHLINTNQRLLFSKTRFVEGVLASLLIFLCLQVCSSRLATTQMIARNAHTPKLEHPAKSTQVSGAVTMKQTKIELDIFSGREPPVWFLSKAETETLRTLLSQRPKAQPVEFEDKLGYRGFFVELPDPQTQKPIVLKVSQGVIRSETKGNTQFFTDTHREVEHWLLNSGKNHLPADLYGIVETTF